MTRLSPRARWLAPLLLLLGCRPAPAPYAVPAPLPETRRALAQGDAVGGAGRYGSHAWLGLPYAAPPVGELRWRAPRPAPKWTGVREALASGPGCPQLASPLGGVASAEPGTVVGSEDCLLLNAWAPPLKPEALPRTRLPVMVWVHGGGNSIGTATFYEGGRLAVEQGVLVVAVQYRLGPLGFFRHPALRAGDESAEELSGNWALLDLLEALRWVKQNAAAFGGDPDNVTLFGESAGGLNTASLLLSPLSKGLLHRAIIQSGGFSRMTPDEGERFADGARPGHRNSSNEVLARALVAEGLAPDAKAARTLLTTTPGRQLARTLKALPPAALLKAYAGARGGWMLDLPQLFRDGVVVPTGEPLEVLKSPEGWNPVPVMVGTNRDEQNLFLFMDPAHVERRFGMFPHVLDPPNYLATGEYLSRAWRVAGAEQPALAMVQSGHTQVFAYRFDWDEEPVAAGTELSRYLGAAHGLEIPFVFGHFQLGRLGKVLFTEENLAGREALSRALRAYWGAFARTGWPSVEEHPAWRPFNAAPGADAFLVLDTPGGGGIRMAGGLDSTEALLADLAKDPRLPTAEARCRVRQQLVGWRRALTAEQYAAVEECRPFALSAR